MADVSKTRLKPALISSLYDRFHRPTDTQPACSRRVCWRFYQRAGQFWNSIIYAWLLAADTAAYTGCSPDYGAVGYYWLTKLYGYSQNRF